MCETDTCQMICEGRRRTTALASCCHSCPGLKYRPLGLYVRMQDYMYPKEYGAPAIRLIPRGRARSKTNANSAPLLIYPPLAPNTSSSHCHIAILPSCRALPRNATDPPRLPRPSTQQSGSIKMTRARPHRRPRRNAGLRWTLDKPYAAKHPWPRVMSTQSIHHRRATSQARAVGQVRVVGRLPGLVATHRRSLLLGARAT